MANKRTAPNTIAHLEECCVKAYFEFERLRLQPGREDWQRNTKSRAEMIDFIRSIWITELQGVATEWPWNDDFVALAFIRERKRNRKEKHKRRKSGGLGTLLTPEEGFVYFISNSQSHIKIGWTAKDPARRLSELQTGSSDLLTLEAFIPGTYRTEKALHVRFAAFRIRSSGEWFYPNTELAELIKEAKNASLRPEDYRQLRDLQRGFVRGAADDPE